METLLGFKDADIFRKALAGQLRRYTYSIPVTSVAASSSVQATISVDSASDFVCNMVTGRVLRDDSIEINRAVDFAAIAMPRLEVIDAASGASLFDRSDVSFGNIWGTSIFPLELDQPHIFEARTVITVIIVNVSTTALRCQVSFHGYKQFRGAA